MESVKVTPKVFGAQIETSYPALGDNGQLEIPQNSQSFGISTENTSSTLGTPDALCFGKNAILKNSFRASHTTRRRI